MNLHKALIANEIFGDGGSGGGSSDFSTATVTMVNYLTTLNGEGINVVDIPNVYQGLATGFEVPEFNVPGDEPSTTDFTFVLYKGNGTEISIDATSPLFEVSGDITDDGDGFFTVTGNGTITIKANG